MSSALPRDALWIASQSPSCHTLETQTGADMSYCFHEQRQAETREEEAQESKDTGQKDGG